jgi:hypothetical protein
MPNWRLLEREDYGLDPAWTASALERELLERVGARIADGTLSEIGAVVLECTVMPQFREALEGTLGVPIFDLASTAVACLMAPPTVTRAAFRVRAQVRHNERSLEDAQARR